MKMVGDDEEVNKFSERLQIGRRKWWWIMN